MSSNSLTVAVAAGGFRSLAACNGFVHRKKENPVKHMRRLTSTLLCVLGLLAPCAVIGTAPALGCGVPLSVQDIQNGIMPSEANLPCQGGGQSSPRPSGPSPAQIERQARWQRASQLNSEANDIADRGEYEAAIARYEQALDLFRANGDTRNMAITQRNLDITRKQYDAIKADNRVSAAQTQYANQNIYKNKGNPFASSPAPANTKQPGPAASKQAAIPARAPSAALGGGTECARILGPDWSWQTVCRPIASYQGTPGTAGGSNINNAINAAQDALSNLTARQSGPVAGTSSGGAAPQAADTGTTPKIKLGDVEEAAADKCRQTQSGTPERRRCTAIEEARAIMDADPEIAAQCNKQSDLNGRVSCALDAYGRKLAQQNAIGDPNCYFLKNGQPCHPGGSATAAGNNQTESLRDRLRRSLSQGKITDGDTSPVTDEEVDAAKTPPRSQPQQAAETGSPRGDTDDPLQNYLQSQNDRGSLNNGTLVRPDSHFSMDGSETDREVNRMQGQFGPPAPGGTADPNGPKAPN